MSRGKNRGRINSGNNSGNNGCRNNRNNWNENNGQHDNHNNDNNHQNSSGGKVRYGNGDWAIIQSNRAANGHSNRCTCTSCVPSHIKPAGYIQRPQHGHSRQCPSCTQRHSLNNSLGMPLQLTNGVLDAIAKEHVYANGGYIYDTSGDIIMEDADNLSQERLVAKAILQQEAARCQNCAELYKFAMACLTNYETEKSLSAGLRRELDQLRNVHEQKTVLLPANLNAYHERVFGGVPYHTNTLS